MILYLLLFSYLWSAYVAIQRPFLYQVSKTIHRVYGRISLWSCICFPVSPGPFALFGHCQEQRKKIRGLLKCLQTHKDFCK